MKITSIYKIITNKDKQIDRQNRQSDRQTNKQSIGQTYTQQSNINTKFRKLKV